MFQNIHIKQTFFLQEIIKTNNWFLIYMELNFNKKFNLQYHYFKITV